MHAKSFIILLFCELHGYTALRTVQYIPNIGFISDNEHKFYLSKESGYQFCSLLLIGFFNDKIRKGCRSLIQSDFASIVFAFN